MKYTTLALLALVAFNSGAATLSTSENLKILAVDGQKITKFNPINLDEGDHLVELRYEELFDGLGGSSSTWVRSATFYANLTINDSNKDYTIIAPKHHYHKDANEYIKSPTMQITSENESQPLALIDLSSMINQLYTSTLSK
ncbi:MAG: DUF2057 family protein [Shewanella sp.]